MDSSASMLLALPQEVVDTIAGCLDLTSICNLRLTCKAVSHLCVGPRFLSFFANQKTDLTAESLQGLIHLANHSTFRGAVKLLTVVAIVYNIDELDSVLSQKYRRVRTDQPFPQSSRSLSMTPEQLDEVRRNRKPALEEQHVQKGMVKSQSDVRLLTDALCSFGMLAAVALEAVIMQGLNEYTTPFEVFHKDPIWNRAAQVYKTVTLAIARSGAAVHALQVYTGLQHCSTPALAIYEHMRALEAADFAKAAQSIKSLSLSISTHARIFMSKKSLKEGSFAGVALLLEQMPNLECLDLHLFTIHDNFQSYYVKLFTCIADKVVLPSLRNCKLRGLPCTEGSLLAFLKAHNGIETLEMKGIHLEPGSWRRIFNHLYRMSALQRVTLSNLRGPDLADLTHLAPKKENETPWSRNWREDTDCVLQCIGGELLHTRTMSREEILRERLDFAAGFAVFLAGALQNNIWVTRGRAEFGPLLM
ncbi:MAG: hypothetical protein Q9222_003473 [Ikaeria aurantiellina]